MDGLSTVIEEFTELLDTEPEFLVRSPGRVNLIGDHTDYNEGLVLPMAIDRAVSLAVRPRTDNRVRLYSTLQKEWCEFALKGGEPRDGWCSYVAGVAHHLNAAGYALVGWDGVVASDVPPGSGLSSSAALELAAAMAFSVSSGIEWDPFEMPLIAHRAENEWVGMRCGVMDQLVVASAEAGHAQMIDCRSLEVTPVPLADNLSVVVLETGTHRDLTSSGYNDRRATCERAARSIGVTALRDVDMALLDTNRDHLDDIAYRRVRHVVTENAAVARVKRALVVGDAAQVGEIMKLSHHSLRDDFEVSTPELDVMFESAITSPGCYGARLTGAGFGGAVIALVAADELSEFRSAVEDKYSASTALEGSSFPVKPAGGTSFEVLGRP